MVFFKHTTAVFNKECECFETLWRDRNRLPVAQKYSPLQIQPEFAKAVDRRISIHVSALLERAWEPHLATSGQEAEELSPFFAGLGPNLRILIIN